MTSREDRAASILTSFAERTGLVGGGVPRRYLWTDAFAVCTGLGLTRATGKDRFADLALGLVDQVHQVLGRHREDDPRSGWISGLDEGDGLAHPTRGGLRIGKPLPERGPDEPYDPRLEWERDGQYFHYLTKWMHALDQVARFTGDPRFNLWARELAEVAQAAFVQGPPGRPRMAWKMSVDLSRPLIPSMGQHDPLDGWITCAQLEATARRLTHAGTRPSLDRAIADFRAMAGVLDVGTKDPLGLGGLLSDACRVGQLAAREEFEAGELAAGLLAVAHAGLARYAALGEWRMPASRRLAFRELGLAIGLEGVGILEREIEAGGDFDDDRMRDRLAALNEYVPLGEEIESFWLDPEHRRSATWTEHRDINEVMLATRLVPEGFLVLTPAPESFVGPPGSA